MAATILFSVALALIGLTLMALAKGVAFALLVALLIAVIGYAGWSSIAPTEERRRAR